MYSWVIFAALCTFRSNSIKIVFKLHIYIYIYINIHCAASCVSASALESGVARILAASKERERSPIFILGWKCTGLRRALQVLMVQWWSFDQAAKINEMSMKHK